MVLIPQTLLVDGKPVDRISDVKPTTIEYPAVDNIPAVHQTALPLRPLGDHVPDKGIREPVTVPEDRGLFADTNLPHLIPANGTVNRTDLTPSLGTLLTGLQLSQLTDKQKDELALLVAHRGVVFFRNQDITAQGQRDLFDYYGMLLNNVDLGVLQY